MDFVLEQMKAKQAAIPTPRSAPSLPKVDLPKVDLPKVDIEVPKVEMPKVDMARVLREVQEKQAELSKNSASSITLPKFEAPKNLPKLEVPKLDMPKIDVPTKDLTDGAAAAASKASAAAAEAAGAVTSAVGENAKQAAAAVSSAASDLTSGISDQVGGVVSSTQSIVQEAQAAAVGASSSLVAAVESQISSAVGTLPPPVRDALTAAASAAGEAAHFVAAEPRVGGAAIAASVAVPAFLVWNAAFGGYSGKFSAGKALDILKSGEAALLVDIRSERQRIDNGVPELKRGARGKGIALPFSKLLPSVAKKVKNADALAIEIFGAQIASLARLNGNTRVIIMDDRGEMAKAVARAACSAGVRRAYIVDGGFQAWKSADLAISEKSSEYDANPLAIVGDAAESVAEEAAQLLKEPTNAVWIAGGLTLAALAAFNYHLLFRYIGVIGIEATIALRVIDYESPQDAIDDFNALVATVVNAAQIPLQLVEKVSSSLPEQGENSQGTEAAAEEQQTV
jgi:rhodanese-related sulfurtransferase